MDNDEYRFCDIATSASLLYTVAEVCVLITITFVYPYLLIPRVLFLLVIICRRRESRLLTTF